MSQTRAKRARSRRSVACAAALAASCASTAASADDVRGTRFALTEVDHRVDVCLDRGHATLVVQRTVENPGTISDQAVLSLDLPEGAVAVGLRTLGTLNGRPHWFRGDLLEAEEAAERYRELTGIGGYYPKDPALLSWRSQDRLALQVFPVLAKQQKTVEYTLVIPTRYAEGRDRLDLPRLGTDARPAHVVVRAARPGDRVYVDDRSVKDGSPVAFPPGGGVVELALARSGQPAIDGALAMVPFGKDRVLVRYGVEAAARLSSVPRRANVVVVLDASRSLTPEQGRAAVAAARAYLHHFSDARVEVLTFDRVVRARHGRFVSSDVAVRELGRLVLERRNGSRVDDALARADALLAASPPGTAKRILALTDARTRSALTPDRLRGLVRSGAIVHVGLVDAGSPSLARDDAHPWAKPVRATGGLVWHAEATAEPAAAAEMRRVYEEWARPLRIDRVSLRAGGKGGGALAAPERLDEGEAVEDLRIATSQVPWIEFAGELWARPVRRTLVPDEARGRLWAAAVFGTPLLAQLDEQEMMVLARHGQAVSPVTSYLAIEPGVRPSTEGLDWDLSGIGEGGCGRGEGIGLGPIGTLGKGRFDHRAFLAAALRARWASCGGGGRPATVEIETTLAEVVDVPVTRVPGEATARDLARCLNSAAWDLDLPAAFSDPWSRWTIEL